MALFGHDDNVRRLSSNLSTGAGPNFEDDVIADDVTGDNLMEIYRAGLHRGLA